MHWVMTQVPDYQFLQHNAVLVDDSAENLDEVLATPLPVATSFHAFTVVL